MNMTIHCPGCEQSLHVPRDASGRAARCPKCRCKFIIPSESELLEETVSNWIEKGLEQDEADRPVRKGDTLMGVVAESARRTSVDASAAAPPASAARPAEASQVDRRPSESARREPSLGSSPASASSAAPQSDRSAPAANAHEPAGEDAIDAKDSAEPTNAHDSMAAPGVTGQSPSAAAMRSSRAEERMYPDSFSPSDSQPRLVVRDVSQSGVVLAFEPRWLEHEGFRASMPVRCAFSAVDSREQLVARPMVFMDRHRGSERSPHVLETRYERHLSSRQPARDLIRSMGTMENMIHPFEYMVVHYVSKQHASQSLHCQTSQLAGGATVCEVTIPDGRVALEWLGRVNGVCGDDYETLSSDVAMLGSDAWRALTEKCRERMAIWCRFQPREQFKLYINDADFGSHDSGLAGVVITDHRLIYHKYHHGGSIELDQPATLHVKTDGRVARLTYDAQGQLGRVGKIHIKDMSKLIETLASAPRLKIELGAARSHSVT